MKFKYPIYYILLLLIVFSTTSCKKLVDVNAPINQLVTTGVFDNDNTAIAAQLAIYAQIQTLPWTINATTALSADELTNYSTNPTCIDLYANALIAQKDGGNLPWSIIYKLIYQENAILENVQASAGISSNIKKLLIGEAEFMRAYFYFYLINLYGNVPLIVTTNYKQNSNATRVSIAVVYEQIIQDLKNAQSSLSKTYLDATDTVVTVDRVRPTTWAASALLARVYLYSGKYDSAEAQSSTVINNTSFFSLPALNAAFLKNSNEAIWQIIPSTTGGYTTEGSSFILPTKPGGGSMNRCCTISPQLLNSFEPGDNRRTIWVGSLQSGASTLYFPYKYKDNNITNTTLTFKEYSMVLRLGELYLIRAEARAQQNKLADAIGDIDALRYRAGLTGIDPELNQTQVLSAVTHERQVELFTEGQRWLDLKRTGTIDSVMNMITPLKKGVWNTNQKLYPLPSTEIQNGINLTQNMGY